MTRSKKFAKPRDRGLPAYAETCPQYLYLSLENMDAPRFEGAKYVFTPPLREKWNQEKLWQGLAKDHLQVVSTDHCPFCFKEQKELCKERLPPKIPNGGPGIEHRLSLVYTGGVHGKHFSPNRFVQLVATAPAKLFGLYPRQRHHAVGSDADLVIFDPNHEEVISAKTHHMRVDYSMFEGIRTKRRAQNRLLPRPPRHRSWQNSSAAPAPANSSAAKPTPACEETMMRAAVLHELGKPPQVEEFPEPTLAEGEVLIHVSAAALKSVDKQMAAGTHYASPHELPVVCGTDGVGRLEDGTRIFFGGPRRPLRRDGRTYRREAGAVVSGP